MIFFLFFVAVIQASIKYAPLPPRTSNTPLQNDSDEELRQYRQPSPTSFANRLSSKLQNILTPPPRPELFPAEMMDLHFGKGKLYPSYCFEGNPTLFPIYYINSHYTIMTPSPDFTTWVPSAFNPFYPSFGDIHRQRQRQHQNHQISSNQATITIYELVPEKPGFYRQPLNLMCTTLVKSAPLNEKDYHQNVHLRLSEQQLQALASHAPPQQQEMIYNQSSVIQGAFYVDARYKPVTVSPYLEFEALRKIKIENETELATILTFQLLSSNHESMSPGFKRILRGSSRTLICCSCHSFKTLLRTDEHHQVLKNLNFEDHLTRQSFVALLSNSAYFRSLWTFHFNIPKEMVLPLCNSFATHPKLHCLIFPPELLARSKRLLKNFKKILLQNHTSYKPSEGFLVEADDIAAIVSTNNIELPSSLPMLKDFLLSPTFFSDYHSHQRRQIYQRLPDIIYKLSGIRYHAKLPFQTVLERILKEDLWGIEVAPFLFWGSPSPMIASIMPMMGVINSSDGDGDAGDFEAPLIMMPGSPPTVGQYQLDGPITHKYHLKAGMIGPLWKEISFPSVESWIPYLARHLKNPSTGLLRPVKTNTGGSCYELQKDGSLYVIASDISDYYKNILLVILYPFLCAGDDKHLIRFSREYWIRLRDISLSLKHLSQLSSFSLNISEHEVMLVREFDKISFFDRCPVEAMFEADVSDDSIWHAADVAFGDESNSVNSDTATKNEVAIYETDFVVEEISKEFLLDDCVVDCLLASDHLLDHLLDAMVEEDIAQQQQKEDTLIDDVLDKVLDAVFIEQLHNQLEDASFSEQQEQNQQTQGEDEEERPTSTSTPTPSPTKTEAQRAAAARKRAKQKEKKKEKKMRDTLENPEFGALCQQLGLYVENYSIADRLITFRPCSSAAVASSSSSSFSFSAAKVSTTSSKGVLSCNSAFIPSASSAFTSASSEDSPPSVTQFPEDFCGEQQQQQSKTVDANGAILLSQPALLSQQRSSQLKQCKSEQQLEKPELSETFRTISQSLERAGFVILDMMGEQILTDLRGRKHFYGSVLPEHIPLLIQHEKMKAALSVCLTIDNIKQSQETMIRNSVQKNLCPSECPHHVDGNSFIAGKRYYDFIPAEISKLPMAISYDEEDALVFFMMFGRLTAKELKKNIFIDLKALFIRHPKMFNRKLVKDIAGKWKSVSLTLRRISGVFLSDSQYRQIQSFLMERTGFDQQDLKNHCRGVPLSIPLKDSLAMFIYRCANGCQSDSIGGGGRNGRNGHCAYGDDANIQSTKIPSVILRDEAIEYWSWVQVYSSFMYFASCEGARMHVEKYLTSMSFERVWIAQTAKSIVEQCIRSHQSYSLEYKIFLLAFNELILNARMMEILRCIPSCKISFLNSKFPRFANCINSLKICSMMARSPLNIFDDAHVLILLKFLEHGEALQSNPIFNRCNFDVDYEDVNASLAALPFCDSNA